MKKDNSILSIYDKGNFPVGTLNIVGFPVSSVGKESTCNTGDLGLIPGSGRSPGEENGNPLQYSCLENSMDRGYSPWGHKETDMTEQLHSLSAFSVLVCLMIFISYTVILVEFVIFYIVASLIIVISPYIISVNLCSHEIRTCGWWYAVSQLQWLNMDDFWRAGELSKYSDFRREHFTCLRWLLREVNQTFLFRLR